MNEDDPGRAPRPTECFTSGKEPSKSEHTSPRTDPVHREEQNYTHPDLLTQMNIPAVHPGKPVAKPTWFPVTEHLLLSSGKIITLGTSFLRRPGRMLSVQSKTCLSTQLLLLPCQTRGNPIHAGKGLHTRTHSPAGCQWL